MAHLLVSFCNVFPSGLALGIFSFDTNNFKWIDMANIGGRVLGTTGILRYDGRHWVLVQLPWNGRSALVELSDSFEVVATYPLVKTGDAHSLILFDGGFLVNDTAKNRLVWIHIPREGGAVREVEYWRYCNDDADVVHVNSVAQLDGDVYVSMFGPKPESGWKAARHGKIVNITQNVTVCDDLFHPHSLANINGMLYWLESGTGIVHRFSCGIGHERLAELKGYVRGITHDDQDIYVGASAARRRSKSTGAVNDVAFADPELMHSWIYKLRCDGSVVERRSLTVFGAEIYDLALVPGGASVEFGDPASAIVQRVWRCEDEYLDLQSALEEQSAWAQRSAQEVVQRDAIIRDLQASLEEQTAWAKRAVEDVVQRDTTIRHLEEEIAKRDAANRDLQTALDDALNELQSVRSSRLYPAYSFVRRVGRRVAGKS